MSVCKHTHTHTGARLAGGAIGAREPPPSSASRLVLRMSSPLLAPLPLDHPPLRCPSSSKPRHVYGSRRPRAVRACVRACVAEASCARLLFPPAFSPTQISLIFGPTSDKTYTLILTRPTDPGLRNIRCGKVINRGRGGAHTSRAGYTRHPIAVLPGRARGWILVPLAPRGPVISCKRREGLCLHGEARYRVLAVISP